ncbi:DNA internalization-related competence protein ComEC/Rec2 [Fervidibacillus albus]|uniref:DNA internalization-related competence protein ComEC/Rec2 n=1 Tax=Fervidibacillus albus TaxID=2980026 RepID=A0A9E8LVB1_9BACI|nr:DNA internalization-related competence protein ComEC/Rec2 [Fervidibacillus albus]WAA10358.1 DNA internalization-related competence protein ComEC/Rec2 [Fervidibacillus albus]
MAIFYGFFAYLGLTALFAFLTYHAMFLGLTVSFIVAIFFRNQFEKKWIVSFAISYFFWLGLFYFTFSQDETVPDEPIETTVTVKTVPVIDGNKLQVVISLPDGKLSLLTYYVQSEKEKEKWGKILVPGMNCQTVGVRQIPPEQTNPNGFHYRRYLQSKNISYLFSADRIKSCEKGEPSVFDRIKILRNQGIRIIERFFPNTVSPIISALLFGEKQQIDADLLRSYQQLGIAHLLAISGLHVSVLTAGIYSVLLRFGLTREATRSALLIILPVYACLAGGAPSVNRAVTMAWLIVFLSKWKRKIHPLDALGISFLFFMIRNPYILYHVGFQLSYAVSFCLLLSAPIIRQRKFWLTKIGFVSMVAQFGSIPIVLYHFYEISFLGFFLNILYVPFYSVIILPLSFTSFFLLLFVPFIGSPFVSIVAFLLEVANDFARWLADFLQFTWTFGKPPLFIFLSFYFFFIVGFMLIEHGWEKYRWHIVLSFFLPFLFQIGYVKFHPFGEVTFIDVGQGDSIWIRLPFHQGNYLIDTGGYVRFEEEEWKKQKDSFDPGEDIVIPFLKSKGVTTIDKLILTHGDFDHIGSAISVLSEFEVGELVVGRTIMKKGMEQEVVHFAKENDIAVQYVFRGSYWEEGGGQFFVLAPEMDALSSNDASVVIYAQFGGLDWLFTGDLEKEGEKKILATFPNLEVDVLKVGHHGSSTSTGKTFLQQIRPKVAVISVGRNNRYGHPDERVVEELQKMDVLVFRTDMHGAITFRFFMAIQSFSTMLKE